MQDLLTETSKTVSFPMQIIKGGQATIKVVVSTQILARSGNDTTKSLGTYHAPEMLDSSDTSTMGVAFDQEFFPIGQLGSLKVPAYSMKGRRDSITKTIEENENPLRNEKRVVA
jgi:hypothetical protein